MKIALNDKDIKEVETELPCKDCILNTYNFCVCQFNRSSIMIEESFLSKIFSL